MTTDEQAGGMLLPWENPNADEQAGGMFNG
jgi:hypothetical protein